MARIERRDPPESNKEPLDNPLLAALARDEGDPEETRDWAQGKSAVPFFDDRGGFVIYASALEGNAERASVGGAIVEVFRARELPVVYRPSEDKIGLHFQIEGAADEEVKRRVAAAVVDISNAAEKMAQPVEIRRDDR